MAGGEEFDVQLAGGRFVAYQSENPLAFVIQETRALVPDRTMLKAGDGMKATSAP
jgi:hypothetical protein